MAGGGIIMAKEKFDAVLYAAKKQAKQDIEDEPGSSVNSVPKLRDRVLKLEKFVGINSAK